ncbi:BA75_00307T0 [Komagataella pastoris]|uniref:BA75_00307T0 n=1 Tax=Komagataella pastoris TaxID=4922 RepID=A0A1B2J9P7_PICPA|nr:BA75_00307T0 [Komagataella pastoris]
MARKQRQGRNSGRNKSKPSASATTNVTVSASPSEEGEGESPHCTSEDTSKSNTPTLKEESVNEGQDQSDVSSNMNQPQPLAENVSLYSNGREEVDTSSQKASETHEASGEAEGKNRVDEQDIVEGNQYQEEQERPEEARENCPKDSDLNEIVKVLPPPLDIDSQNRVNPSEHITNVERKKSEQHLEKESVDQETESREEILEDEINGQVPLPGMPKETDESKTAKEVQEIPLETIKLQEDQIDERYSENKVLSDSEQQEPKELHQHDSQEYLKTNDYLVSQQSEESKLVRSASGSPQLGNQEARVSPGPFILSSVVRDIPIQNSNIPNSNEATITCIEAWDQNLYIGTSVGEILHMFKLDDETGYILISRQSFHTTKIKPIKKILLLPSIDRALVHCGSLVSIFMLPEFSPANVGKIKDVTEVSLDYDSLSVDRVRGNLVHSSQTKSSDFVQVSVFTSKFLRLVNVYKESIKLHKDISYANATTGLIRSHFALISNGVEYDLLDVNNLFKVKLFPVSSGPSPSKIKPLIAPVSQNEFLLSCGTKQDEPAMGMVVDTEGNISRGTIPWNTYPSSLNVDYPFSIEGFSNYIYVHSLHNQQEVQSVKFSHRVKISQVSHLFYTNFKDLKDLVTKIPVNPQSTPAELERITVENDLATKYSQVPSSTVVYSNYEGVKLLQQIPRLMQFMENFTITQDYSANELSTFIDDIQDEMNVLNKSSGSNTHFESIEWQFLNDLCQLLFIESGQYQQLLDYSISAFEGDPRVLVSIFQGSDDFIGESIWMFQGLIPKMNQVSNQHINQLSEGTDAYSFFESYLLKWFSKKSFRHDYDKASMIETLEIAMMKLYLLNNKVTSENFSKVQKNLIKYIQRVSAKLEQLLIDGNHWTLLIKYYQRANENLAALSVWRNLIKGDYKDEIYSELKTQFSIDQFIKYFISQITDETVLWDYGNWLLGYSPSAALRLFSSTDLRISVPEIKVLHLIDQMSSNKVQTKFEYLDILVNERHELQFLGDYLLELLPPFLLKLQDQNGKFDELIKIYQDLKTPKLVFTTFLRLQAAKSEFKEILATYHTFSTYLSQISQNTVSLSNRKTLNVVNECFKKLEPYQNQIPYLIAVIESKRDDHEKVIDILLNLTDFHTAEQYAVSFRLAGTFPDSSEGHKSQLGAVEKLVVESDNLFEQDTDISTDENTNIHDLLLMSIFDRYLILNDSQLIEHFLNKYNIFKTEQSDGTSDMLPALIQLDNFNGLLNKIPDNLRIQQINSFLLGNLLSIEDSYNDVLMRKNLTKGKLSVIENLYRDILDSGEEPDNSEDSKGRNGHVPEL